MNKSMKTAFPSWIAASTLASGIAVLGIGCLAWMMLVHESAIHRLHQWRVVQYQDSSTDRIIGPSDGNSDKAKTSISSESPEDSDRARRWEGVLAQTRSSYIKVQKDLLDTEIEDGSSASIGEENQNPRSIWFSKPEKLSNFVLSNRKLLDSAYQLLEQPFDCPQLLLQFRIDTLRDLIFWDIADSLSSKDPIRMSKGLAGYFRVSEISGYRDILLHVNLICLLHLALDEKLIDAKNASAVLKRIGATPEQTIHTQENLDAWQLSNFIRFGKQHEGLWLLPSIKEAMFEEWNFRNNDWGHRPVLDNLTLAGSMTFFTLAVRVASILAVEETQRDIHVPEDVLARLELPPKVRDDLLQGTHGKDSITSLFTFDKKTPGPLELKFNLENDISVGLFPIRTTYEIPTVGAIEP